MCDLPALAQRLPNLRPGTIARLAAAHARAAKYPKVVVGPDDEDTRHFAALDLADYRRACRTPLLDRGSWDVIDTLAD